MTVNEMYEATITCEDGEQLVAIGTIAECSNWLDNVVRIRGSCSIEIIRIDEECKGVKQ